jgi:hypothetical protein
MGGYIGIFGGYTHCRGRKKGRIVPVELAELADELSSVNGEPGTLSMLLSSSSDSGIVRVDSCDGGMPGSLERWSCFWRELMVGASRGFEGSLEAGITVVACRLLSRVATVSSQIRLDGARDLARIKNVAWNWG